MPLRGLIGERSSIVLFGDSLTQRGWGPDGSVGWASSLSHTFQRKADVFNRGYGGYNTRWAAFLAPYLFPALGSGGSSKHLLVTVWFGANDAAAPTEGPHVPLDEYEANLGAIIGQCQRASLAVVVLTPPPVHEATRLEYQRRAHGPRATGVAERTTERAGAYAAAAKRVAARRGVRCLDVHGLMLAEGGSGAGGWPSFVGAGDPAGDGLHLSATGQRFVADRLVELLLTATGGGPGEPRGAPLVDLEVLPTELPLGSAVDPSRFQASLLDHQVHARALAVGNGHARPAAAPAASPLPWGGGAELVEIAGLPVLPALGCFAAGAVVAALTLARFSSGHSRWPARSE